MTLTASSSRSVPLSRAPNVLSPVPRLFWVMAQIQRELLATQLAECLAICSYGVNQDGIVTFLVSILAHRCTAAIEILSAAPILFANDNLRGDF